MAEYVGRRVTKEFTVENAVRGPRCSQPFLLLHRDGTQSPQLQPVLQFYVNPPTPTPVTDSHPPDQAVLRDGQGAPPCKRCGTGNVVRCVSFSSTLKETALFLCACMSVQYYTTLVVNSVLLHVRVYVRTRSGHGFVYVEKEDKCTDVFTDTLPTSPVSAAALLSDSFPSLHRCTGRQACGVR
jgi:hypothetical protein